MEEKCVNEFLLNQLKYLLIASRLRVSLSIKLADHAAQLMGYRSTRQVNNKDDVEKIYINLINTLTYIVYRCMDFLNEEHFIKANILSMDLSTLENMLETALFESTIYSDYRIFKEYFFK